MNIERFALQLKNGVITGNDLKEKVDRNELTKGDRRKIMKVVEQMKKKESMSQRQLLRLAVKEKKKLPKLSKDDRRAKYQKDRSELDREREREEANFTICLGCRKRGHFVKDCPKRQMATVNMEQCGEVCFNCGSFEHTLKNCPMPRDYSGALPFAKCFICKQTGHISRDCPENANGLYPKGGCCHICFQKTHLAKDCPDKKDEPAAQPEEEARPANEDGIRFKGISTSEGAHKGDDAILDEQDFEGQEEEESDSEKKKSKKKKSKKRQRE